MEQTVFWDGTAIECIFNADAADQTRGILMRQDAIKYEVGLDHYVEVEFLDKAKKLQREFSVDLKYMQSVVKALVSEGVEIEKIEFFIKITVQNLENNKTRQADRRFAGQRISPGVLYALPEGWIDNARNNALPEIERYLKKTLRY